MVEQASLVSPVTMYWIRISWWSSIDKYYLYCKELLDYSDKPFSSPKILQITFKIKYSNPIITFFQLLHSQKISRRLQCYRIQLIYDVTRRAGSMISPFLCTPWFNERACTQTRQSAVHHQYNTIPEKN